MTCNRCLQRRMISQKVDNRLEEDGDGAKSEVEHKGVVEKR